MIRRPPRSTQSRSSAASDVYKRQAISDAMLIVKTVASVCADMFNIDNVSFWMEATGKVTISFTLAKSNITFTLTKGNVSINLI